MFDQLCVFSRAAQMIWEALALWPSPEFFSLNSLFPLEFIINDIITSLFLLWLSTFLTNGDLLLRCGRWLSGGHVLWQLASSFQNRTPCPPALHLPPSLSSLCLVWGAARSPQIHKEGRCLGQPKVGFQSTEKSLQRIWDVTLKNSWGHNIPKQGAFIYMWLL